MELSNLLKFKQHGDAVRIASIVNKSRRKRGQKAYSAEAIRKMLNGTRTMNDEVAEIATRYYQAQSAIMN
ncbi:hypothetical protein D0T84_21285 [Dysgonomonas sp. 521]|uniref:hypothetical protein n=1 Tax=Dysgonomonas sp. 521 TaxID=2302932 RepID=UPI0013D468FC|nr:hypothetical protein [Dysgonomonas sp. 521]NDV97410.1 hypothetical protein [Dysgonomonas sp. 521]